MFWKAVAANIVASFITLAVLAMLFTVGTIFLFAVLAGQSHPEQGVHNHSILVFDLDTDIMDSPPNPGPADIFTSGGDRPTLYDITSAIDEAARDSRIAGLFLTGSLGSASYADLREIRQSIERFKNSGKKVYAYLEDPSIKDYYLATSANQVALNPFSFLSINGIAADSMFLGDALKKYGVGVQVTRVGKYKSATEIFTGDHMSDADREQLTALLDGIWDDVLGDLAASRPGLDVSALRKLANEPGLFLAADALKLKLVDRLAYLDDMIEELKSVGEEDEDNYSFYQVSLRDYSRRLETRRKLAAGGFFGKMRPRIAVIYAEGDIVDGSGGANEVGGDELAYYLRYARNEDNIKAVVLRVDSPGGSAMASEVAQREVRLLREAKKPVIVSMGGLAASGGYWISAYGDYIYAEPTTITGSIGVFGLKFNVQQVAGEHGVTFDSVQTATYANMDTLSRPWSPDEVALAQTMVDFIYDEFLDKVSEGRKLSLDHVREIAQGRVWSGTEAKKLGLVNEIGGLGDAIAKAESVAGLAPGSWTMEEFPERRSAAEVFLQALAGGSNSSPVAKALAANALTTPRGRDPVSAALQEVESQGKFLRSFNDPRGIYARLPYLLRF